MHSISKLPMTLLLSNDSCCCSAVPGFYITQHIGKSQSCFWPLITASLQHIRLFLLGEHTRMWGPRLVVFIAVQHTMLTNFSVITYLNTTLHALSCSHSVKKKKWNPNILIGIKTEMKVLKKKKKSIFRIWFCAAATADVLWVHLESFNSPSIL